MVQVLCIVLVVGFCMEQIIHGHGARSAVRVQLYGNSTVVEIIHVYKLRALHESVILYTCISAQCMRADA